MAIISQKWPPTSQDMAIISQKWPPTSQDMAVISHKWPLTSSRHGGYFPKVAADLCETWRLFLKSGRRPTILRSSLNVAADLRKVAFQGKPSTLHQKTQWSSSKNQRAADPPNEQMLGEDGEPKTSRQERCEDPADQRPHVHLPTPKSSPSPLTLDPPLRPSSTQSDAN